jgi:hypothetical protein
VIFACLDAYRSIQGFPWEPRSWWLASISIRHFSLHNSTSPIGLDTQAFLDVVDDPHDLSFSWNTDSETSHPVTWMAHILQQSPSHSSGVGRKWYAIVCRIYRSSYALRQSITQGDWLCLATQMALWTITFFGMTGGRKKLCLPKDNDALLLSNVQQLHLRHRPSPPVRSTNDYSYSTYHIIIS